MVSISPSVYRITSTSTLATEQPLPGDTTKEPYPRSPHSAVAPDRYRGAGPYGSGNSRSYADPQTTIQGPGHHRRSSKDQGHQSGGRVSRRPSRRDTVESELPTPMPIDPEQFDSNEPQKVQIHGVYGYVNGAKKSRASLQNGFGDRNRSRKDVSGKDSRE